MGSPYLGTLIGQITLYDNMDFPGPIPGIVDQYNRLYNPLQERSDMVLGSHPGLYPGG